MKKVCPICGSEWRANSSNQRNKTCSQSCGNSLGSGTPWTSVEIENLKRLYAEYEGEKVPTDQIGKLIGKTGSAVRYKAHKLGLTDPGRPRAHVPGHRPATYYDKVCANPACQKEFSVPAKSKHQVCCGRHCAALYRLGGSRSRGYSRARAGKREDLDNRYFRSRWEANYARYLNWLQGKNQIRGWEYEPKTFYFPVKRGNTSYTPDFLVYLNNDSTEWHEIKGWMDDNSRVKLKRFAKHYPEENATLQLIQKAEYNEIAKAVSTLIDNWEE